MAEESLGTAKVDIVVDTTQFDTAINKAKTSVSGMSQAAQAEYAKLQGAEKRRVDSLIRQADQLGLTREQQILYNAELKKVPTAVLDELKNKVAASTAAVSGGVSQMNQYGMSAKATAAAMRGVPAQITDIVTSLQGGQRPMTVLLQQGGQLKDMFGGIAPAARALGTAVLGMINPFTLAAGAAAALTAAWVAGSNESQRFTQSLILTGNYSGFTADQLGSMADRMSNVTGTAGKAADALTKIVSTGRFTGGVIEEIGLAAIAMEKATGQAVDKTIDQFEELAKSPSDAILKLNDQYHFLTASVYEQIAALEQQNQKDEAAALAQRTFAAAVQQRAGEVISSAGLLERAWNGIAGAAKGAWDAMLNIGRPTPVSDLRKQAEQIQEQINQLQFSSRGFEETAGGAAMGNGGRGTTAALNRLKTQLAELNGVLAQSAGDEFAAQAKAQQQQLEDDKTAASQRLAVQKKAVRDRKTVREEEIAQMRTDAKLIGLSDREIADREKAILAKYKDPKGSTSGPRDDAATKLLQQLRERETATQAQLASEQKLTTAQQERVKYEQLFSDLKNKQVLTADQKSLLLNESLIKAQLDRNVAAEQELRTKKEAVKIDAMRVSLSSTLAADQQQYAEQLKAIGLGRQAQEELRAQQRLFKDYQRDLQRATQSMLEGGVSQETYQKQTELLQGSLDDRLALQRRYYDSLRTAQEDWRNGAKASLADYVNATRDVAGMTGQLFTNAFKGMEDALTSFVTTGKLSFSDLANSIIADMVRIAVQQNITGPLAGAIGSLFSGSGSPAHAGVTPGVDFTYSAKGNVYDSLSLSRYSNQIHDTPKLFQFAKGAGVFAEAGPEAIMPLKRGSDGSLGVRAQLPDAGGVVVNINNQGQAMTATGQPKISRDSMGRLVIDVMTKDLQANGPYIRQLKGAMA